jgi:hypothetical protein
MLFHSIDFSFFLVFCAFNQREKRKQKQEGKASIYKYLLLSLLHLFDPVYFSIVNVTSHHPLILIVDMISMNVDVLNQFDLFLHKQIKNLKIFDMKKRIGLVLNLKCLWNNYQYSVEILLFFSTFIKISFY